MATNFLDRASDFERMHKKFLIKIFAINKYICNDVLIVSFDEIVIKKILSPETWRMKLTNVLGKKYSGLSCQEILKRWSFLDYIMCWFFICYFLDSSNNIIFTKFFTNFQLFNESPKEYERYIFEFSIKNQLRYRGSLGECNIYKM